MTITATYYGTSTVSNVGIYGAAAGIALNDVVRWGFDIQIDPATTTSIANTDFDGNHFTDPDGDFPNANYDPEDALRFGVFNQATGQVKVAMLKDGRDNIIRNTLTVDNVDGTEIAGGEIVFEASPAAGSWYSGTMSIKIDFTAGTFYIWNGGSANESNTSYEICSGTISGKTEARLPASPSNSTSGSPYGTSRSLTGSMTSPMTLNIT